ncbi:MAG: acetyltransferase [Treponema sp.]|nr:acetyltransferase [Treponema sp.]
MWFSNNEQEKAKKIYFKKLSKNDFELLLKWLNTDFVKEWYYRYGDNKQDWTHEEVQNKYLPRIRKKEPTDSFIILYDDTKIGYIQTYLLKDYPEYEKFIQGGDNSAGMDLFIGEKEFIHKGLGAIIIKEFIRNYIFCNDYINKCIIGPEPKNLGAIKAYTKAGFKYVKTHCCPA